MPVIYLGIDPGASGAVAWVTGDRSQYGAVRLSDPAAAIEAIQQYEPHRTVALLERVASMPGQGVASTFKFGTSYGWCQGALMASGVSFALVTPAQWQGEMSCRTKGDKNISKAAAERLYPRLREDAGIRLAHWNADALLLAELCRRRALGVTL